MFLLSLISLFIANAQAEEGCSANFFSELKVKVALHSCQGSLKPNCSPPSVSKAQDGTLIVSLATIAGSLPKAAAESLTAYHQFLLASQEEFAKRLRSGEFFTDKLYGRPVFSRIAPAAAEFTFSPAALIKGIAYRAFAAAGFYFVYSESPERCKDTVVSRYIHQKFENHDCVPDLTYGPEVLRFLDPKTSDQENARIAKSLPEVCSYYTAFSAAIDKELDSKTRLLDFSCKDGRPKAFKAEVEGVPTEFTVSEQSLGQLTGFSASAKGRISYAVDFQNGQSVSQIHEGRSSYSFNEFVSSSRQNGERMHSVSKLMKAWWSANPVLSVCCAKPQTPGCRAQELNKGSEPPTDSAI